MPEHQELTNLAIVALVALLCGVLLTRLRQPAVVGYILAGVVLGPSVTGLVSDQTSISILAEMGVLMLLFVIGMELSLRAFRTLWVRAVAAMLLQLLVMLAVMGLLRLVFGWPLAGAILLAFVITLSSTAVAIKMLEDIGELRTHTGRIAISVLIAQDLAVVPMILLLDIVAQGAWLDWGGLARLAISIALLVALTVFLSRRKRLNLPVLSLQGQPDLIPLVGLAACFGAAALAGAAGMSAAYGAFLAGLIIGNSNLRPIMLTNVMPIQSILMMVFFLSIGLLIDVFFVWDNLAIVATLLAVVTILKTVVNVGILRLLRLSWPQSFLSAVVLAQVGEFSFLLAGVAGRNGIIGEFDFQLIVTVTALSLAVSPVWLAAARRLHEIATFRRATITRVMRYVYGPQLRWLDSAGRAARKTVRHPASAEAPPPARGDDADA